jgi:hypothetical protein
MRINIVKKSIMNNNPIRPRVIKKVRLKLLASLICKSLNLNQTIKNNLGKPPTKTSQSLINCNILSKLCIFANILSLKQTRVLIWILQECGDFTWRVSDWWCHLMEHPGRNETNYFMYRWAGPNASPGGLFPRRSKFLNLNQAGV